MVFAAEAIQFFSPSDRQRLWYRQDFQCQCNISINDQLVKTKTFLMNLVSITNQEGSGLTEQLELDSVVLQKL